MNFQDDVVHSRAILIEDCGYGVMANKQLQQHNQQVNFLAYLVFLTNCMST